MMFNVNKGQNAMNNTPNNTPDNAANNVVNMSAQALPDDTSQALRILIRHSEQLVQIAERETQVLVQNDMRSFAVLQDEKEKVSKQYAGAAGEFHSRLEDFRGADPGLLQRLDDLQQDLGERTKSNTTIVERIFKRSQEVVHNNLISIQELAQLKPIKNDTNATNAGNSQTK